MSAPAILPGLPPAPPPYRRGPAAFPDAGWEPFDWAGRPLLASDDLPFWPFTPEAGSPVAQLRAVALSNLAYAPDAAMTAYLARKGARVGSPPGTFASGFLVRTTPAMAYATSNRVVNFLGDTAPITVATTQADWFRGGEVLHVINITFSELSYFFRYVASLGPEVDEFRTDAAQLGSDRLQVSAAGPSYARARLAYLFVDHPGFHGDGFGDYVLAGMAAAVAGLPNASLTVLSGSDLDYDSGALAAAQVPGLITDFFGA